MVAGNEGSTQDRPRGVLEAETSRLSGRLGEFSEAVRETGRKFTGGDDNAVSRLTGQAADSIESACRYLNTAEPRELVRDVTALARRRPEVFIGGAVLAGLVLGRFLRSTPDASGRDGLEDEGAGDRDTPASCGFTSRESAPDSVEGGSW